MDGSEEPCSRGISPSDVDEVGEGDGDARGVIERDVEELVMAVRVVGVVAAACDVFVLVQEVEVDVGAGP